MLSVTVELESDPSHEDVTSVAEGLHGYNREQVPSDGYSPLTAFVRNAERKVVGGLLGKAGRGWFHVDILWIDAPHRGTGLGSRLMDLAETEAVRRGCHGAWLDTFSYQARPFYERRGYVEFGRLEDYPRGHQRYFMWKTLDELNRTDAAASIRPATFEDAGLLAVLGAHVWMDTYATDGVRAPIADEVLDSFSLATIQTLIADDTIDIHVAEHDLHIVGFAQLRLGSTRADLGPDRQAELERLYVHRRYAGLGIGTALLETAEHTAIESGVGQLWLTVWSRNPRARGFYDRRGYSDEGAVGVLLGTEIHENRLMVKRLVS